MKILRVPHPETGQDVRFFIRDDSSDHKGVAEIFDKKIYHSRKYDITLKPDDVWADMGGNIGAFAVYAAKICKKVYCYEPEEENIKMIKKNLELNNTTNVVLVPKAVVPTSYKHDKIVFYVSKDPNHFWMHSIFARVGRIPNREKVYVPVQRFGEIPKEINCLKIDIEGAEIPIFQEENFERFDKIAGEWSFEFNKNTAPYISVMDKLQKSHMVNRRSNVPDTWTIFPYAVPILARKMDL